MELATAVQVLERAGSVDLSVADRETLVAAIADFRRVGSFCHASEINAAAALARLSSFPEKDVADATRGDVTDGVKAMERVDTTAALPELGAALADGDVGVEHVDVAGRVRRGLDEALRPGFDTKSGEFAEQAAATTPREFARLLNREARRLEAEAGVDRLQRQRHSNRAKTWVDEDGMWNLRAKFDPVNGARLAQRLNDALAARMAQPTPPDCPTDPFERMDWLRAMAVADIFDNITNTSTGTRGTNMVIIVDATDAAAESNDGQPVVDWGIPVDVPFDVVLEMFADPDTTVDAIVIRNGVVIHAPGRLDLGRSTRMANRAQRRALRAMYSTCAVPGCDTHFNNCNMHHIIWWRNGGRTDLINLAPLCIRHHHLIHDCGWHLTMTADRTITITLPDGRIMTNGPPRRKKAA